MDNGRAAGGHGAPTEKMFDVGIHDRMPLNQLLLLGLQNISIRSVAQKGIGDGASLVMITHRAPESAMAAAIGMISGLGFVRGEPRAIRVFDEEDA